MIFPGAGAHGTRQDRIKRDRDATRKADLAAMGMAAQQEIEVGTGSPPIHFRRVRDQNRKLVVGYRDSRLLDVVHSVEMGIVDAAEMEALAAALNNVALVEQSSRPISDMGSEIRLYRVRQDTGSTKRERRELDCLARLRALTSRDSNGKRDTLSANECLAGVRMLRHPFQRPLKVRVPVVGHLTMTTLAWFMSDIPHTIQPSTRAL